MFNTLESASAAFLVNLFYIINTGLDVDFLEMLMIPLRPELWSKVLGKE